MFVSDSEAIFEKWQKSTKQDPTSVLEDKILIIKNWLSDGLVRYARSRSGSPIAIKDEEKLFERLINTHGLERSLGVYKKLSALLLKVKGLNLDKKRHSLSL